MSENTSNPSPEASMPIACEIQTSQLRISLNFPLLLRTKFWVQGCKDGLLGWFLGQEWPGVRVRALKLSYGALDWFIVKGGDEEDAEREEECRNITWVWVFIVWGQFARFENLRDQTESLKMGKWGYANLFPGRVAGHAGQIRVWDGSMVSRPVQTSSWHLEPDSSRLELDS